MIAGVWRRIAAYLVDVVVLAIGVLATQALLRPVNPLLGREAPSGTAVHAWVLVTVSVPIATYFAASYASGYSATLGMRAFGLAVRSIGGDRLSWPRSFLRAVILLIPWELNHVVLLHPQPVWMDSPPGFRWGFAAIDLLLLVYVAVTVVTEHRQGPHDLAAKTVVVDFRP